MSVMDGTHTTLYHGPTLQQQKAQFISGKVLNIPCILTQHSKILDCDTRLSGQSGKHLTKLKSSQKVCETAGASRTLTH